MAGTKAGAKKRRETLIRKAGGKEKYLEMQRKTAAKGGANHNPNNPGSFANRDRDQLAPIWSKGGRNGRRKEPIDATADQPEGKTRVAVEPLNNKRGTA